MVSLGQTLRIYLVKVVGLQLTYVLHGHMAFMIFFTGRAGSFHISLISLKLYRQVSLLFIGLTWCQRIQSSDQHSVSDWCLLSEC